MRIPTLIAFSSLLICGWLGLAFIRDVPSGSYPLIERSLAGKDDAEVEKARITTRIESTNEP